MPEQIDTLVKTIIQTQVIQALNSAPEAIEKLVAAALEKPVDKDTGKSDGYSSTRIPYLDWMIGGEIRDAARDAVRQIIKEHTADVEAQVRKALSADSVVAAVSKSLIGAAEQEWRIKVDFEAVEKSRY